MSEQNTHDHVARAEAERLKAMREAHNIRRFGFGLGALKTRVEWPLLHDRPSRRDA